MTLCDNCKGAVEPVFDINPDPTVREPVRGAGSLWLLPQRLDPSTVALDELAGLDSIDVSLLTPGCRYSLEWYDDQVPDPDNEGEFVRSCGFRICEPEARTCVVEWTSAESAGPALPANPEECCGGVAINVVDPDNPCKTHDFICDPDHADGGYWITTCAASVTPGNTDDLIDCVCYDVSGWTFPASYSAGDGQWAVFGVDQMSPFTCNNEQIVNCPVGIESDGDSFNDSGSSVEADVPWNQVPWTTSISNQFESSVLNGCDSILSVAGSGHRAAYRVNFGAPAGSTGPLVLEFDHYDIDGTIAVALYDIISGAQLPVTILAQPAGNPLGVISNSYGPLVQGNFGGSSPGLVRLAFTVPAGVDPANVRALFWNMGASGGEGISDMTLEFTGGAGTGCFTWQSVNSLAAWLNSNDPNGNGWAVDGDRICREVTLGSGAAYGLLASSGFQSGVDVDQVASGSCGGGTIPPPSDGECVVTWCVIDANNSQIDVTVTEQADGSFTPTYSPGTPASPIQGGC